MKRKNILKFVSLLGISSFVMLAAASCTTPVNPTPNPEPKPDPMPNPGGGGGMSDGNTNPGNGGGMMGDNPNPGNTTPEQQLATARKTLIDLIGTENNNVALYSDYVKIQNVLRAAYETAKTTSANSTATLDQVRNAITTLQAAIDKSKADKKTFDDQNPQLLAAYNELKTELQNKTTHLDSVKDAQYGAIHTNLTGLYDSATKIVDETLIPTMGNSPMKETVEKINTDLKAAVSALSERINNVNKFFTGFDKHVLSRELLSAQQTNEQPANYSFVGYNSDLTFTGTNNQQPNWSFAQREVWRNRSNTNSTTLKVTSNNSDRLSDVTWIYSLAGENTKYTLTFNYYGNPTANLYFPYKLVRSSDNVGLEYKLNDGVKQEVIFSAPASAEQPVVMTNSETEVSNSGEIGNQSSSAVVNKTPTVSDINVAKVVLSNLKFGQNTIEFSVPAGEEDMSKVAPMIGNMYLTSSNDNENKVYDDIFGNSINQDMNSTSVTVDLLKGYSLAANWSTYFGQFMNLNNSGSQEANNVTYLVGYIGGNLTRTINVSRENDSPRNNNNNRSLTIYINAPVEGEYYISGSYLTNVARDLKFSTGETNNVLTITGLRQDNWQTLGKFDTSTMMTGITVTQGSNNKTTLKLKSGLNKVVITGGTANNTDTPDIGNLTFKLMTTTSNSETNTPA
ncbi:FIVAR domain-containing protein [Mycoplasmoides gallisepticum]|uniref:VlhA n=1 Tax=Mycoplasmoides gallisepticum TaxID=2096 RepID=A0A1A6YWQ6_MYCGL|nr:FIVAR domain-containing protein [Mycoplasmoides gallisepticum]ANN85824.1 VlhA [Mycoplasmoides gallisepticum]OBU79673.1 hypothetical protein BAX53_03805 [Mycoplasmoides gallisepticum]